MNPATCSLEDLAKVAPFPEPEHDAALIVGTKGTPVYYYRSPLAHHETKQYAYCFVARLGTLGRVYPKKQEQTHALCMMTRATAMMEELEQHPSLFAVKEENGQPDPRTCLCGNCFQQSEHRVTARAAAMENTNIAVNRFDEFEPTHDPLLKCIVCGASDTELQGNQEIKP